MFRFWLWDWQSFLLVSLLDHLSKSIDFYLTTSLHLVSLMLHINGVIKQLFDLAVCHGDW